jgi:hypothetical protein
LRRLWAGSATRQNSLTSAGVISALQVRTIDS